MARVIPIRRAHHYRRKRRRKAQRHVLAVFVFGGLLFASQPTANQFPSTLDVTRDKAAPRSINRGQAWGGFSQSSTHSGATPLALAGRVTRVRDGDTFVVGNTPVRIANLDCAERGTAKGDRATQRAKALISGASVSCRLHGRQSYDREIGECTLPDGRDLGAVLIAEGICDRRRG